MGLELPKEAESLVEEGLKDFDVLLQEHQVKIEKLQEEIRDKAKVTMQSVFKDFFEKYPEVRFLYWNQYTPYFNDGEECYFSVNDLYAGNQLAVDEEVSGYDLENYKYLPFLEEPTSVDRRFYPEESQKWDNLDSDVKERAKMYGRDYEALANFISSLDEHLKVMFGDHVEIIVNREGIQVNEFSHE